MSAFARLASGTVLVGGLVNLAGGGGGTMGAGYRSTDGAVSFQPWTLQPQPHLIGLGERVVGGQATLYLSGKNYSDGWALAVSTDEGATVTPVMRYDQVAGIRPCVQQICLATCNYEEMQAIWDLSVCGGPDGGDGRRRGAGPPAKLRMPLRRRGRFGMAAGDRAWLASGRGRAFPSPAAAPPGAARPALTFDFPTVVRLDSRGSAV